MKLEDSGKNLHINDPLEKNENLNLFVQLMDPTQTFRKMSRINNCEDVLDNRILKVLTKPYGGLNEILSIVELNIQKKSNEFDIIVLDTPPGGHFLDFLDSMDRIKVFFDQSFVDIFQYLGKKIDDKKTLNFGKRIVTAIASSGVKKLLSYLDKVTGEKFVDEFVDAVIAIYKTKGSFIEALDMQKTLRDKNYSHWYLVTSVEQNKLQEALELQARAKELFSTDSSIILNKCLEVELMNWEAQTEFDKALKMSLLNKELNLKDNLKKLFKNVFEFPEIISLSPKEHVNALSIHWAKLT